MCQILFVLSRYSFYTTKYRNKIDKSTSRYILWITIGDYHLDVTIVVSFLLDFDQTHTHHIIAIELIDNGNSVNVFVFLFFNDCCFINTCPVDGQNSGKHVLKERKKIYGCHCNVEFIIRILVGCLVVAFFWGVFVCLFVSVCFQQKIVWKENMI